jgi:hypothetical protein
MKTWLNRRVKRALGERFLRAPLRALSAGPFEAICDTDSLGLRASTGMPGTAAAESIFAPRLR